MSERSAAAIRILGVAADKAKAAADELHQFREEADQQDMHAAGAELVILTHAIDEIAEHLTAAATHYGDRHILGDDADADPAARMAEVVQNLKDLRTAQRLVIGAVHRYHTAIGHITIQVDPDAETD